MLARAFRDNPLNVAVIGGGAERRLRVNRHGMRAALPVARAHGDVRVLRVDAAVRAVLLAVPPLGHPLPPPAPGVRLRVLLGQGLRVALRWNRVFETLAPLHPPEPHWYLGMLGVEPRAQGRGLGSGGLPLELLERKVDEWIAAKQAG